LKTHHAGSETWRCDACGAFNDEPLQVCSECKAQRLGTHALAKDKKKSGARPKQLKSKKVRGKVSKKKETKAKAVENLDSKTSEGEAIEEKAAISDQAFDTFPPAEPESLEPVNFDESVSDKEKEIEEEPPSPSYVVSGAVETSSDVEEERGLQEPETEPKISQMEPEPAVTGDGQYSLVYVNTPVSELVKHKIDIDFDSFAIISIGRSPENVVVIPDGGVSRTHAELRRDGNRVLLKDLQSSNGTYIYDGKDFQKVEGSVEVRPNSLVKLGTGTILRLVSE